MKTKAKTLCCGPSACLESCWTCLWGECALGCKAALPRFIGSYTLRFYAALPEGKRSSLPTMAQSTVSLYCLAQSPVPRTPWRTGTPQTIRCLIWRERRGMGVTRILVDAVTSEWPWLFLPVGLRLPSCAQGLPCYQNEERGWRRSSKHFGGRLRARLRGQRVESWDPSCNITHCGYSPTAQPGSTDLQQESEVSQVSDGQATPHILGCHVALLTPPALAHVYQLPGPTLGFLGGSHYITLSCHTLQD